MTKDKTRIEIDGKDENIALSSVLCETKNILASHDIDDPSEAEWLIATVLDKNRTEMKLTHIADCLGRTWQCGTIQLDMQLPERFELEYVGQDGEKHRPVMIHRVVFGSIERFIGVITEHFAGAFPTWLAPVQAIVLPITDRAAEKCKQVQAALDKAGIRCDIDLRNEKIGFKIREAQIQKIPYMLVLGDKEVEQDLVAVRSRKDGDLGTMSLEDFLKKITEEVETKAL